MRIASGDLRHVTDSSDDDEDAIPEPDSEQLSGDDDDDDADELRSPVAVTGSGSTEELRSSLNALFSSDVKEARKRNAGTAAIYCTPHPCISGMRIFWFADTYHLVRTELCILSIQTYSYTPWCSRQ